MKKIKIKIFGKVPNWSKSTSWMLLAITLMLGTFMGAELGYPGLLMAGGFAALWIFCGISAAYKDKKLVGREVYIEVKKLREAII